MNEICLNEISRVLSANSVLLSTTEQLQPYKLNCEGRDASVSAVVKIANKADIKAILLLANRLADTEQAFSVYPISTGHNWGYTSASANDSRSVLLDLSALTNISLNSKSLGLVTVEPGVTQQMLWDFFQQQQLPFLVPVTGAGPSCSILANALERGYGITPFTDHFAAVNSVKAYLADGSFYQSAISELDQSGNDFIDKTFKYGIGPYLDGIFTQSGFGIVTEVTLRLKARPQAFDSFYIQYAADTDFEAAVTTAFTILQQLDGIVGSVNLMDQRRLLSMMADNPNGRAVHQAMSAEQVRQLAKQYDTPGWMLVGTLYGQKSVVKAARKEVKAFVAGKAKRIIFSEGALLTVARRLLACLPTAWLTEIRGMLSTLDKGIEVMLGKPNQVALPLAYWRNPAYQAGTELNPAADGCGLLWYAPLIPMDKVAMRRFINMVREICPKYGIEPLITFTSLKYDTVDSTVPIVFNRQDPAAVAQAQECLQQLVNTGLKHGWVPYRLNLQQQQQLLDQNSVFWQFAGQLKQAVDPHDIVSPGRYQPGYFSKADKKTL